MARTIENLEFKGGGFLGIAYAGALIVLEQKKLNQEKKVAGTSSDAITTTLVSLRYTEEQITTIVNQTDFKSFEEDGFILDALHPLKDYGFIKEILLKLDEKSDSTSRLSARSNISRFR